MYMVARGSGGATSSWQALGTCSAPGSSGPTGPPMGGPRARAVGSSQVFTFTFNDTKGWRDLGVVNILVNNFAVLGNGAVQWEIEFAR